MPVNATGLYYMDGMDLWTSFNIIIEKGTTEFLRKAPKKEGITHDWPDAHGIDTDVSQIFLAAREGTLNLAIIVDSEADFWVKHDLFFNTLLKPGLRRLEITAHQSKSYFIHYKSTGQYTQVQALTGKDEALFGPNKVSAKFSITVVEPMPQINNGPTIIITHTGQAIIT
jgi:hypothetical protein